MKSKMPQHCKGCASFHNAGRRYPKGGLEKYNAWCCRNGQPANKSIGWCKTRNMKVSNDKIEHPHDENPSDGRSASNGWLGKFPQRLHMSNCAEYINDLRNKLNIARVFIDSGCNHSPEQSNCSACAVLQQTEV